MSIDWEVWLDDARGNRIMLLDGMMGLSLVRVANNVGAWDIILPGDFDVNLVRLDGMVEFWRTPEGGSKKLINVGMCRGWTYSGDDAGLETLIIWGCDGVELLNRRIVAYAADSAQASKNTLADNMIKAIVRENLGALAVAARDLTALNFTVAPDVGLGPTIELKFAWKPVLQVCQDIAGASREAGTDLYFDVVPVVISTTAIGFEFRTYVNQIGMDRTLTGGNPMYIGKEWGNLSSPSLGMDYSKNLNYIYGGGDGEGADRLIVEVSNTWATASVWNRVEGFADARNEITAGGITTICRKVLDACIPREKFSGTVLDTGQARYGIDWEFGDKVTVNYKGFQTDGMIRAVKIVLDESGAESIDVKIEVGQ